MTDYQLKTPGQIYADNPVIPSATDLILLWKSGAMGAATVNQLLSLIVAGAPDALDDINELAAAIGDDENFAATVTALINAKLAKASNLADLPDKAAARNNLGLQLEPSTVAYFARSTAPNGWLKANGALVSRTTYADLFAACSTTFGVGDGSTTFGLPDLRGEFLRGFDDSRGIDAARVFGSAQEQSTENLFAEIVISTVTTLIHQNRIDTPDWVNNIRGDATGATVSVQNRTWPNGTKVSRLGTGETRPRNVALLACIKY